MIAKFKRLSHIDILAKFTQFPRLLFSQFMQIIKSLDHSLPFLLFSFINHFSQDRFVATLVLLELFEVSVA